MRQVDEVLRDLVIKLDTTCQTLRSCKAVSKRDRSRIEEAFELLSTTILKERNNDYKAFLKSIVESYRLQIVVLCAVCLGKAAFRDLRQQVRHTLSDHIQPNVAAWECEVLWTLVDEYKPQGSTNTYSGANIQLPGPTSEPSTAASPSLPTDEAHDFEILQKILEKKGMSQNKTCIEVMDILFPNRLRHTSHQQSVCESSTTHQDLENLTLLTCGRHNHVDGWMVDPYDYAQRYEPEAHL